MFSEPRFKNSFIVPTVTSNIENLSSYLSEILFLLKNCWHMCKSPYVFSLTGSIVCELISMWIDSTRVLVGLLDVTDNIFQGKQLRILESRPFQKDVHQEIHSLERSW